MVKIKAKLLTSDKNCVILTKKMIEAHLNIIIRREKACAGVAAVKGLGAEDLPRRAGRSGNSDNIRFAVAFFAECYLLPFDIRIVSDSRVNGCFLLDRDIAAAEVLDVSAFFVE